MFEISGGMILIKQGADCMTVYCNNLLSDFLEKTTWVKN